MDNNQEITKVLRYIEENMRVTEQTSIEYLDVQGNIDRLSIKQNHIIFGRRGSGKSLLLKALREKDSFSCISVNMEDFKDISFPNSIIQVQKAIIKQLIPIVRATYGKLSFNYWKESMPVIGRLKKQLKYLDAQLANPDEYEQSVREKKEGKFYGKGKAKSGGSEIESGTETSQEVEVSRQIKIDKLDILKNGLTYIKELFTESSAIIGKDIYLILDDFYFIRKSEQPYFLDFFHRVSKNSPLYLKVATIKHRSKIYVQGDSYIGIELPHDAQTLNLDYSLEDFESLVSFMNDLLRHVNEKVNVNIKYSDLITDNAFRFLCLASGGVPRDFFSLLISLGPSLGGSKSITKPNVIEKAIENIANKMEAFKKDSGDEEILLVHYLKYIRTRIIDDKKWNAFLVSNTEIQNYPQINQAIKELVDMRFLHLVNSNISAAHSDGTRYSAYMVDIGLFPNSNPRKFQQIEPGQRDEHHRKDQIRSAPQLHIDEFSQAMNALNMPQHLSITD
jgi:hypothetical protein